MIRQYFRILKMCDTRLTKQIFIWDKSFFELLNIQTWSSEVRDILLNHNLGHIFAPEVNFNPNSIIKQLKNSMAIKQNMDLKNRCLGKPKLRNYVQIKDFDCKESYLTIPMAFVCRKHLALTRLSNLPIRMETARYERPKVDANHRLCQIGYNSLAIEDEGHVIFFCNVYNNLRIAWYRKLVLPPNFSNLDLCQKLKTVLSLPENVKCTAQYLVDICNVRSKILAKKSTSSSVPNM